MVSEDVIVSRVILDISMSLDGLIAQSDDDPGPIQEFLFSGETELDGMFRTSGATTEVFREFIDSAGAVITGRRTYDVTNGWEGNHPMRVPCFVVPCFVVTHDVPTDVPGDAVHLRDRRDRQRGSSGQGRRRREGRLDHGRREHCSGRRLRPSCSTRSRSPVRGHPGQRYSALRWP